MEYTKGEWTVVEYEVRSKTGRVIAKSGMCDSNESLANIRLIASAPDLYEAIKIWLDKIAPYSLREKTEFMEKALAKAEGK